MSDGAAGSLNSPPLTVCVSVSLKASHPQQHQRVQGLPEHLHRRAQHALQQAVRALQVVAVPPPQDGVEEQRVPGPLQDPGPGFVRCQGPGEAHHGHRVHRHRHPQRGGQPQGEDLRVAGATARARAHAHSLFISFFVYYVSSFLSHSILSVYSVVCTLSLSHTFSLFVSCLFFLLSSSVYFLSFSLLSLFLFHSPSLCHFA